MIVLSIRQSDATVDCISSGSLCGVLAVEKLHCLETFVTAHTDMLLKGHIFHDQLSWSDTPCENSHDVM